MLRKAGFAMISSMLGIFPLCTLFICVKGGVIDGSGDEGSTIPYQRQQDSASDPQGLRLPSSAGPSPSFEGYS